MANATSALRTVYRVTSWVQYEGASVQTFDTWEEAVEAYDSEVEHQLSYGRHDGLGVELSEAKVMYEMLGTQHVNVA